ncbi:hypothetical protein O6H91_09G107200 [Diphasiastrum complanatum]|uniref:Uncharacterized protein n=4 Tax=Diphasiastrum complanatum TaxID=34168 RepID=A0ACC2CST4_DIPCM|nr:hypothetical protein O6H91_09G107200 [Diphasiastrum complanatum]KAJ7545097.1 hypothetical protein O6H91_09G107200 [Diphasiastrum complanatum]KAJ7545098.1 hypothetical protein O6H91_09G107200 [Diphasiastrum complanatum]KAJ7545099.1 hypothetical protein O6H91_09G107200 [Diphasiastrum complanatum]
MGPTLVDKIAPAKMDSERSSHSDSRARTIEGGFLSIVILGASGDLAKKKTFPAIFNLFRQGFLPLNQMKIIGYARSPLSDQGLRDRLRGYLKAEHTTATKDSIDIVDKFLDLVTYISGPYDSDKGFMDLNEAISSHEQAEYGKEGPTRRLFYLALPPSVYIVVGKLLRHHCINQRGWTRVVVEKPFGKDLASAEELSKELGDLFTEQQIYRIDHYLGKEIVQNLLVMRFANRFFVPIWNRDNIANVQIVFKENFGTEGRGGYFDEYGIIRDIIQNHLLQVLCLVAMEKPVSLSPEHVRDEKVKVLRAIEPIQNKDVVLGQYDSYRDDPTVSRDSRTPTFAAVVVRINNERWDGVPFILRAGKALDSRKAEIRVQFRDAPGDIFKCKKQGRNEFVMRLQPSEAMYMKLTVKQPGLEMSATQSELDLSYHQRYQDIVIPEAYERLILDTIRGDQQHFVRRDELQVAWQIFTPLLHQIDDAQIPVIMYKNGSRGPLEAEKLVEREGYVRTSGYIWIPPSLKQEK